MIILFYISGLTAIITTVCVILNRNPMYALLYLILSLLSISCNLFSLKASLAGSIEIIVYAGAVMVLFIFSIMMLNMNSSKSFRDKEFNFLPIKVFFGILLLMGGLLTVLLYSFYRLKNSFINMFESTVSLKQIGIALFGSYIIVVEIASFLLLSALISVLSISQKYKVSDSFISNYTKKERV